MYELVLALELPSHVLASSGQSSKGCAMAEASSTPRKKRRVSKSISLAKKLACKSKRLKGASHRFKGQYNYH